MRTNLIIVLIYLVAGCSNSEQSTINFTPPQNFNCLPANLQNDIIAFYAFNNGSILDSSANNNDLTNSTSASSSADRDGNPNCAFHFDPNNGEFLTNSTPSFLDNLQNNQFSISLWYISEQQGGIIMSRGDDLGNCHGVGVGEWQLALWDNNWPMMGINSYRNIAVTPIYQINEWHHLAVTFNSNTINIYQDGTLLSNVSNSICPIVEPSLNVGDFFIGKNFKGTLDDIIIYNRELNSTEINQIAGLAACCQ